VTPLPPPLLPTLRAVLDRIIPADEFPGALAAGTDGYVLNQLAGAWASEAPLIVTGLLGLNATATRQAGTEFAVLAPAQQDALLTALDASGDPFFVRLVDLAHEGFYADPANGGNRDGVSWRMLGYDPGATTPSPSGRPSA